jgi:tetratricopeptide (TPR) repeat protein
LVRRPDAERRGAALQATRPKSDELERVVLHGGAPASGVCALLLCALISANCEGVDVLGGVFISYRREDSGAWAGRVYDRLVKRLGSKNVFLDVDDIQPGLDFVDVLTKRVAACDALVAVIGKGWISAADKDNRRRLDDPHDYVRVEIDTALERGVRVIPVLVQGAAMPKADELPDPLKKLANRQGIEISLDRFDSDVKRLTRALASLEKELHPRDVTQASRVVSDPPAEEQSSENAERERPHAKAEETAWANLAGTTANAVLQPSPDDTPNRELETPSRVPGTWRPLMSVVKISSSLTSVALYSIGALLVFAISALLYKMVTSAAIEVLPISMPRNLVERGYTSETVAMKLRDSLRYIQAEASSGQIIPNEIVNKRDEPTILAASAGLSIDSIAATIQSILSLDNWWRVSGYVDTNSDQLRLNISLDRANEYKTIVIIKSNNAIDELFSSAAQSIYEVIDPYVVVMSLATKDPTEAMGLAHHIIGANPPRDIRVAWARILIGIIQNRQGKLDAAIEEYKEVITIDPQFAYAHVLLGDALKLQGNLDAAIGEYRRAIAIEPNNPAYEDALKRALAQRSSPPPPAAQTSNDTAPTPSRSP